MAVASSLHIPSCMAGVGYRYTHPPVFDHEDNGNKTLDLVPFKQYPSFLTESKKALTSRLLLVKYIDKWITGLRDDQMIEPETPRVNFGLWEPALTKLLWDNLIGNDTQRIDMLRLPTRPNWHPVSFSPYIIPCVYLVKGGQFPMHRDSSIVHDPETREAIPIDPSDITYPGPVNFAKLTLYPEDFDGGGFVLYDQFGQKELAHIDPSGGGTAVLFDLWYPHVGLPIESNRRKIAMGLRVLYMRD